MQLRSLSRSLVLVVVSVLFCGCGTSTPPEIPAAKIAPPVNDPGPPSAGPPVQAIPVR